MTQTSSFHIGDILSITTGRLVSPRHIDGVYDILNWMTGDNLFTHQLPRAAGECAEWLAEQVRQHGETREVAPLAAEEHTYVDPFCELRMMKPDAEVIAVLLPDA